MTRTAFLVSLLMASSVFAQPAPTSVPQKPTGEESAVRDVHKKFTDAWNQHDAAALSGLMTEKADYTEPDGRTAFGRAEIEKLFRIEHGSVFKQSELHLAVERVRFLDDKVALVDGSYELFKARDTRGAEIGTRTGYFVSAMVKTDGKWLVDGTRLFLPAQLLWRDPTK